MLGTSRILPSSFVVLGLALGACDADSGRTAGPSSECLTAKCDGNEGGDEEARPDNPCADGLSSEQRVAECRARFPESPLWAKARPGFEQADDPLYYINRWHSVDPCFVNPDNLLDGDSLRLTERDFEYISTTVDEDLLAVYGAQSYGMGLAERPDAATWVSCTTKIESGLITPPPLTSIPNVQIRADAWESPLPAGYRGEDGFGVLDPQTGTYVQGFRALFEAAALEGITLTADSGYRGARVQEGLFDGYGEGAEIFSANPMHSEHQLGTAIDMRIGGIGDPKDDFSTRLRYAQSTQLAWVRDNAHRFGVVLSYPLDRVDEHQYVPEPWHFRYVGVEAATLMYECGLSTEELLGAMYGDELPPMPEFSEMDAVYDNITTVGYDAASCWYATP